MKFPLSASLRNRRPAPPSTTADLPAACWWALFAFAIVVLILEAHGA